MLSSACSSVESRHSVMNVIECGMNGLCNSTVTVVEGAVPCYRCERRVSLAAYCLLATLLMMRFNDVYVC